MDEILKQLAGYGPPGIAVAVALYAVAILYRRNEKLNDALRELSEKYATTTIQMTNAVDRLSDLFTMRQKQD